MSTYDVIILTFELLKSLCEVSTLHVNLNVDMNKWHVNIIMLHVDMI